MDYWLSQVSLMHATQIHHLTVRINDQTKCCFSFIDALTLLSMHFVHGVTYKIYTSSLSVIPRPFHNDKKCIKETVKFIVNSQ